MSVPTSVASINRPDLHGEEAQSDEGSAATVGRMQTERDSGSAVRPWYLTDEGWTRMRELHAELTQLIQEYDRGTKRRDQRTGHCTCEGAGHDGRSSEGLSQ